MGYMNHHCLVLTSWDKQARKQHMKASITATGKHGPYSEYWITGQNEHGDFVRGGIYKSVADAMVMTDLLWADLKALAPAGYMVRLYSASGVLIETFDAGRAI